jgi:hypothetical protein
MMPPVDQPAPGCPHHGLPHGLHHSDDDRHDPPSLLGPEGGGPRRDDDGGADGRGGVATRAVEEDEDPGVAVDPGWMP